MAEIPNPTPEIPAKAQDVPPPVVMGGGVAAPEPDPAAKVVVRDVAQLKERVGNIESGLEIVPETPAAKSTADDGDSWLTLL